MHINWKFASALLKIILVFKGYILEKCYELFATLTDLKGGILTQKNVTSFWVKVKLDKYKRLDCIHAFKSNY